MPPAADPMGSPSDPVLPGEQAALPHMNKLDQPCCLVSLVTPETSLHQKVNSL